MPRKLTCLVCMLAMLTCRCNDSRDDERDKSADGSAGGSSWMAPGVADPEMPAAKKSAYTGGKVAAKIKFKPGRYAVVETMADKGRQTVEAGGRSQKMDSESDMLVAGEVVINPPDADTGERRMVYTCKRVKMTATQAGRRKTYDSQAPIGARDRELGTFLGPLVGWKGVQVYSRDGKFLRLEGLEHLLSEVAAGAGGGPGGKQAVAMAKKLLEPLLRELLTRHWGKLLPAEPVAPGDTWRKTIELENFPMFGKLAFKFACRAQDVRETAAGKVLVFDANGNAAAADRPLDMDFMPMPMKVDINAEKLEVALSLTAEFDTDIGLATGVAAKINVKAILSLDAPDGSSAEIKMNQDARSTYSLKPAGTAAPGE